MNGFEVIINWAGVAGAAVLVGWLLNGGANLIGLDLSENAKKAVVFAVSAGLAGYFAFQQLPEIPAAADDPAAFALLFLGIVTATFKAAQQIYDRLWQPGTKKVASVLGLG
jgi:hypothetical protein